MELFLFFFKSYPKRTLFALFIVTIASIIAAFSLLLLPAVLFTLLGRDSAKTEFINNALTTINISPNTENLIILFLIGIVIQNILIASANIFAGFTKAKAIKDLRTSLLSKVSSTEWVYFNVLSSGNFTVSLVNEVETAADGYETMVLLFSQLVQTIAYLSVAFILSWQIACIAILTSIILTFAFSRLINASRALGTIDTELTRKISAKINDSYRSIKSLKAMGREAHSYSIISGYTKQLKSTARKSTVISETLDALQEIIVMSTVIITLYFSFKYLDIPLEYSIILIILYLKSMKLFTKSQKQYQTFVGNIHSYSLVKYYLDDSIKYQEHRPGTKEKILNGDIQLNDVSFNHGIKNILDSASATFYHHKLNTVIGASGEGKSTTADIICGLYLPTSGEILIDGTPLNEINIKVWRNQIGYVTQENNLLSTSIRENITLGDNTFTDEDVQKALSKAHCTSFVDELPKGMHSEVGENGSLLSGGQRQRILIARALVHSPKLLILDEATSALDSRTEQSLSQIFKELTKELTIISISHRTALIEASDHIIELENKKFTQR